jgi:hypothetical protein
MASSVGEAVRSVMEELVLDEVVQLSNDPKYTKPRKYDKEAWRGDEDQDQGEQYIAKSINVEI